MSLTLRGNLGRAFSLAVLAGALAIASAGADAVTRQIASGGTATIRSANPGTDQILGPELRPGVEEDDGAGSFNRPRHGHKKPKFQKKALNTPKVATSAVTSSNPEIQLGIDGLNHRNQRLANGGNQFSVEPPDQALCVGNGFVVESVNSVLRVYSATTGASLTGVQDLNTFFGYPAAFNRATGAVGPDVIDPICLYDADNSRFIVAITTLHVDVNGDFNGKNTIDVAVSNSGDPTGIWTIYSIPAQNDGTDGTPDHGCTLDGTQPGPCFQDYPHIGADATGIYITTNEYDLFGPNYIAAQIFALSKAELAAHSASIRVTLVENLYVEGMQGFTVQPANSPIGHYSNENNGTEYFLSTIADVAPCEYCTDKRIALWALSNTKSLDDVASPALKIDSKLIKSQVYVDPPNANQKPGNTPLRDCINDTTMPTIFGPGCWQLLFVDEPAHDEVLSQPDANDTRMQQTWYVNGVLWGAAATGVDVAGKLKAGIAWFAVEPEVKKDGKVQGSVKKQGYLALANNNLTYPALAIGTNGRGAIAFSVLGDDYYPSAGYALIDATGAVGPVHVAAAGLGPADGFTSYKAFVGDPPRTRWGDYGAAVTDGTSVWIASEYIAQTCTLAQYYPSAPSLAGFGSCGATRTSLGNWATRITKLTP